MMYLIVMKIFLGLFIVNSQMLNEKRLQMFNVWKYLIFRVFSPILIISSIILLFDLDFEYPFRMSCHWLLYHFNSMYFSNIRFWIQTFNHRIQCTLIDGLYQNKIQFNINFLPARILINYKLWKPKIGMSRMN